LQPAGPELLFPQQQQQQQQQPATILPHQEEEDHSITHISGAQQEGESEAAFEAQRFLEEQFNPVTVEAAACGVPLVRVLSIIRSLVLMPALVSRVFHVNSMKSRCTAACTAH